MAAHPQGDRRRQAHLHREADRRELRGGARARAPRRRTPASRHGVVHDKLYLPGLQKLKRLIDSGFFGRILSVRGEFGYWVFEGDWQPAQRPSWNYRTEDGGGIIVDMFPHWNYVLENLFGRSRDRLRAGGDAHPRALGREGRAVHRHRRRRRVRHLRARGRHRSRRSTRAGRCACNRDELVEFQVDGTHGSAVVGLFGCEDPAPQRHPEAGVEPRPRRRPTTTPPTGSRCRRTTCSRTASRRSGRSSCATCSRTRRTSSTCSPAPAACGSPRRGCARAREGRRIDLPARRRLLMSDLTLVAADGTVTTHARSRRRPRSRKPTAPLHVAASPTPPRTSCRGTRPTTSRAHPADIDWDATLAFRHHVWSWGLGVADAMDTAQRNMGLDCAATRELIAAAPPRRRDRRRRARRRRQHRPRRPTTSISLDQVIDAYIEQLALHRGAGAGAVLMASRHLARAAETRRRLRRVYREVLARGDRARRAALARHRVRPEPRRLLRRRPTGRRHRDVLRIIEENADQVARRQDEPAGCRGRDRRARAPARGRAHVHRRRLQLRRPHRRRRLGERRRALRRAARRVRRHHARAPPPRSRRSTRGDPDAYRAHPRPDRGAQSRQVFAAPTFYYKTGVAFLSWLNGHQPAFQMVGGLHSARSLPHLSRDRRARERLAGALEQPGARGRALARAAAPERHRRRSGSDDLALLAQPGHDQVRRPRGRALRGSPPRASRRSALWREPVQEVGLDARRGAHPRLRAAVLDALPRRVLHHAGGAAAARRDRRQPRRDRRDARSPLRAPTRRSCSCVGRAARRARATWSARASGCATRSASSYRMRATPA